MAGATPVAPHIARRRALAGLLLVLLAASLLAVGWLSLRDSRFFRVEQVDVSAVASSEEPQIRQALEQAALGMTTLHVREDELRDAVRPYTSVAGLRVETDLPHRVRIEVLERTPVAALATGARRVPVTVSGLLLRGVQPTPTLPDVRVPSLPAGDRVRSPQPLAALAVAGAAPPSLRARVARIWSGPDGLVLDLRNGPELIFGSREQARTKWLAAARVLADPAAAGAAYLDVRVPDRVAAGGKEPLAPDEEQPDQAPPVDPVLPGQTPTPAP